MKSIAELKALQEQAILRLNCPGYGASSLLACGQARPLTDYKVIIVNPLSIIHLFEQDPHLIRQVETAQIDEMTSCKLGSDELVDRISQQIEARAAELFQFLAEGGLLIFYLCRPFVVSSDNRALDNYAWLCGLAPDQAGEATMSEQTIRHMSTVAHGRNIDKCPAASESEFEKYLEQMGLEWNTIIRTDFLTNGYAPLAQAGPKKCIAGELIAGDKGGKVVFLPAPYSPDFDHVLVDCINLWYATKPGFISNFEEKPEAPNGAKGVSTQPESDQASLMEKIGEVTAGFNNASILEPTNQQEITKPEIQKSEQSFRTTASPEAQQPSFAEQKLPSLEAKTANFAAKNYFDKNPPIKHGPDQQKLSPPELNQQKLSPQKLSPPELNPPALNQLDQQEQNQQALSQKDNLPKIVEGVSQLATVDDWCKSYWLPGMDNIFKDIQATQKQIRELEKKLAINEQAVSCLEEVKATLLSTRPGDFLASCNIVLQNLGWATGSNGNNELVLAENGHPVAIARLTASQSAPERGELARLTESLISFWDSQGIEPKGILIACTFCDTPIPQRKEPDFPSTLLDFAVKKNICLISTLQLIVIYLDIKLGKIETNEVRAQILSTAGALPGFAL